MLINYAFLSTVLWYNIPNKTKNHTSIPFVTWFCWKSKDYIMWNGVQITEGSDNGDSDNQGPTVCT